MRSLGIEVLPLADLCLPEPSVSDSDLYLPLKIKAAVISAEAHLPTIGCARSFMIDPLLRYGGGGPQWRWSVPWLGAKEDVVAELIQADNALNSGGYCGPDDRGAIIHTVLCLAWPDARTEVFEGRMKGQFAQLWYGRKNPSDLMPDFAECFVPDGETATIADLDGDLRQWNMDEKQAIDALRRALEASSMSLDI